MIYVFHPILLCPHCLSDACSGCWPRAYCAALQRWGKRKRMKCVSVTVGLIFSSLPLSCSNLRARRHLKYLQRWLLLRSEALNIPTWASNIPNCWDHGFSLHGLLCFVMSSRQKSAGLHSNSTEFPKVPKWRGRLKHLGQSLTVAAQAPLPMNLGISKNFVLF